MKLLQLNTWAGRLSRQIIPFVVSERPDFITAQEIFSADEPIDFPSIGFNLTQDIARAGSFPYVYFSPVCSFQVSGRRVHYGNAIFSVFPLGQEETFFTHGSYHADAEELGFDHNTRNAQLVSVDTGRKSFYLLNHHAFWDKNPLGVTQSETSMQLVANRVRKLGDTPIVLAGDLNLRPQAPALQVFNGLLRSLTVEYGISSTLTSLGIVQENIPCDHVFVSNLVQVKRFEVSEHIMSDHAAILTEFEII